MAEWWYHVIHICPTCKATWDEYDPSGGGYDSGSNSCPRVVEECTECAEETWLKEEREEHEREMSKWKK